MRYEVALAVLLALSLSGCVASKPDRIDDRDADAPIGSEDGDPEPGGNQTNRTTKHVTLANHVFSQIGGAPPTRFDEELPEGTTSITLTITYRGAGTDLATWIESEPECRAAHDGIIAGGPDTEQGGCAILDPGPITLLVELGSGAASGELTLEASILP